MERWKRTVRFEGRYYYLGRCNYAHPSRYLYPPLFRNHIPYMFCVEYIFWDFRVLTFQVRGRFKRFPHPCHQTSSLQLPRNLASVSRRPTESSASQKQETLPGARDMWSFGSGSGLHCLVDMMASQDSCWSRTFGSTGLFEQRRGSAESIIRLLSSAFCLLLPYEKVVLVDRVSIIILLRVLLLFIISGPKV